MVNFWYWLKNWDSFGEKCRNSVDIGKSNYKSKDCSLMKLILWLIECEGNWRSGIVGFGVSNYLWINIV